MKLKEAATRQLNPAMDGERVLVNKIVLEQVYPAIPAGVRGWLSHNQLPLLAKAARLLENFFWDKKISSRWGVAEEVPARRACQRPRTIRVSQRANPHSTPLASLFKRSWEQALWLPGPDRSRSWDP